MTDWNDFRFVWTDDGVLHLRGRDGFREPICPECGEPIKWVLDIMSFTTGPDHRLAHASCLWTAEGIRRVAERAPEEAQA